MIYNGRYIDVLALWGELVDLPDRIEDPLPMFLPKVRCPNPEHETTKSHFQINTKKPLVHCFANCGISGDYIHAIKIIKGCDEREAKRTVLRASRVPLAGEVATVGGLGKRKSIAGDSELEKDRRALDGGRFTYLPKQARAYLTVRGVDGSSRGKWQIGYDEDSERLVIPAYDERSILRFLIRQRIDGISRAKYLYTDGSIKTSLLFGACYMERERLRSHGLILCEGPLDAVRMHQLRFSNAVSILGSGISQRQVRLIDKFNPKRVYLMFDKDEAGAHNVDDAKMHIRKLPLFVCRYPKHRGDPAEMTREEVERSLSRALSINEFFRRTRRSSLVAH
jgi:DNA primase